MYGVPAFDRVQKCSILSGDQIVSYLARELCAERIIHGTDVDGIFTCDPKKCVEAELIKEINEENIMEVKLYLDKSPLVDVTGGMLGKFTELLDLARLGIDVEIVNANKADIIRRVLKKEKGLGTLVKI